MKKLIFILCLIFAVNVYAQELSKDELLKKKKQLENKKVFLEAKLNADKIKLQNAIYKCKSDITDVDSAISAKEK